MGLLYGFHRLFQLFLLIFSTCIPKFVSPFLMIFKGLANSFPSATSDRYWRDKIVANLHLSVRCLLLEHFISLQVGLFDCPHFLLRFYPYRQKSHCKSCSSYLFCFYLFCFVLIAGSETSVVMVYLPFFDVLFLCCL